VQARQGTQAPVEAAAPQAVAAVEAAELVISHLQAVVLAYLV
jgi:hypothetical protein